MCIRREGRRSIAWVLPSYLVRLNARSEVWPPNELRWNAAGSIHIKLKHEDARMVARIQPGAGPKKGLHVHMLKLNARDDLLPSPHPALRCRAELALVVVPYRRVEAFLLHVTG